MRFRLDIVAAYRYTCALTGYRVTTIDGASIIDAAHIHPVLRITQQRSQERHRALKERPLDVRPRSMVADDDYRVIVAHSAFDEDTRDQKSLRDFHGQLIGLPANPLLWPDPQHLLASREQVLRLVWSSD